ncbi:helix-turn-helix transcriptional regulator [Croceicoccus gelatinilyticus]|uniref:helix-turn-helix transcriptional regulator n=1 Tax=Croceicoccus gelatinilyticus TaxID=2835536 RepID=UPI001BCAB5DD|nr:AlpA family phage regulatory protein [Croceicoccus gelatinilyticus]MBS7669448.1 AlpA family phage regulatory protein [Croceicoccus gelatinilyticus]
MNSENSLVLDLRGVIELTTLSQSTIYALAKKGEFPKQKRIGPNRVVWRREEVVAWLDKKLAEAA